MLIGSNILATYLLGLTMATVPGVRITWDPLELPPKFWLPLANERGDQRHCWSCLHGSACVGTVEAIQLAGNYGQLSNALREWVSSVEHAVLFEPPRAAIAGRTFEASIGGTIGANFDIDTATRSWACTVSRWHNQNVSFPPQNVYQADAGSMFAQYQSPSGALFHSRVLHQLLLRPTAHLRSAVDSFLAQHNLVDESAATNYVSIHLRWPGGWAECVERFAKNRALLQAYDHELGRPTNGSDVCDMSSEYIRAVLRREDVDLSLGLTKFILLHDGQNAPAEQRIISEFGAIKFSPSSGTKGVQARHADMLMGIRSMVFIGNPTSTFSTTIAAVRKVALGYYSRSNLIGDSSMPTGKASGPGRQSWKQSRLAKNALSFGIKGGRHHEMTS